MKVLVVDDEKPARDRLRQLLDDEPQYDVVGEAANGAEAVDQAVQLQPDIVLLDDALTVDDCNAPSFGKNDRAQFEA